MHACGLGQTVAKQCQQAVHCLWQTFATSCKWFCSSEVAGVVEFYKVHEATTDASELCMTDCVPVQRTAMVGRAADLPVFCNRLGVSSRV